MAKDSGKNPKKRIRWWVCGEGHLFSYGDEDWHYEEHADQGGKKYPIPRHCPCDFPDDHADPEIAGESCMESSYLWGPFKSREEGEDERPGLRRRREGERQLVMLRVGVPPPSR
jgi:hypothetical protein